MNYNFSKSCGKFIITLTSYNFFSFFHARYELVDSAEQRFTIKQGIAGGFWLSTTSKMIDYEESSNYSIVVKSTDSGIPALSYQQKIIIQVRI